MSFSRRKYDRDETTVDLRQQTSVLDHAMDLNRYRNCNECRIPFGVVGGNEVSRSVSNAVDVESDLFGLNIIASRVPSKQWAPSCPPGTEGMPDYACKAKIPMNHLGECTLITYKPKPTQIPFELPPVCATKSRRKHRKHRKHRK